MGALILLRKKKSQNPKPLKISLSESKKHFRPSIPSFHHSREHSKDFSLVCSSIPSSKTWRLHHQRLKLPWFIKKKCISNVSLNLLWTFMLLDCILILENIFEILVLVMNFQICFMMPSICLWYSYVEFVLLFRYAWVSRFCLIENIDFCKSLLPWLDFYSLLNMEFNNKRKRLWTIVGNLKITCSSFMDFSIEWWIRYWIIFFINLNDSFEIL